MPGFNKEVSMKKIMILGFALVSAFISNTINASEIKCPSVHAIKSLPFSEPYQSSGHWFMSQKSDYDTGYNWEFELGYLDAKNAEQAKKILYKALKSLAYTAGPQGTESIICSYSTDYNVYGFAVTHPNDKQGR